MPTQLHLLSTDPTRPTTKELASCEKNLSSRFGSFHAHRRTDEGCESPLPLAFRDRQAGIEPTWSQQATLCGGGCFRQQATLCGGGVLPVASSVLPTVLVVPNFDQNASLREDSSTHSPTRFLGLVTLKGYGTKYMLAPGWVL